MPAAWEITVGETLALLRSDFPGLADAVARGNYALWLGSGISLERVVGVPAVIGRVMEFLRSRIDTANPDCRYKAALDQVLAELSEPERARLHLDLPVNRWPEPDRRAITCRLAGFYAEVLETPVEGEVEPDFLLWQAVDVPGSFTSDDPDVEHFCVVMLTLEGAFRDISSANWDYLIEAAERDLAGAVGSTIDVCIRAEDFQNAGGRAKLLKYHGCAVRAVQDPFTYRPLLIARTPQIKQYHQNAAYHVMRAHLVSLVQQRRTLMIGFSAQDSDVQQIFVDGAIASGWNWTDSPKAFVFSEDQLKPGQRTVLSSAYPDDYAANRLAIEREARLCAYAKPLLLALLLSVLELKVAAFAECGLPATWPPAERELAKTGLRHLRDEAADAAEPDRRAFIHALMTTMKYGLDLYHHGHIDHGRYIPLSIGPIQQIPAVSITTGLRQASVALAILGHAAAAGDWALSSGVANDTPIELERAGHSTRVFLAANDDVAVQMIKNGHVDPDTDDDTILLLSASPKARLPRSPSGGFGRTGKIGLREVCMTSVIGAAANVADLVDSFKRSASL